MITIIPATAVQPENSELGGDFVKIVMPNPKSGHIDEI